MATSTNKDIPTKSQADRTMMLLLGCWVIATGSSLGSLFFSEIMELPPCSLCWYQRCFMFPLAIVLLVGVVTSDRRAVLYSLPLSIGGTLIALYHVLVHVGIIPEDATPCQQGVSCSETQFELFGFASIPMLSLFSFAVMTTLLVVAYRSRR